MVVAKSFLNFSIGLLVVDSVRVNYNPQFVGSAMQPEMMFRGPVSLENTYDYSLNTDGDADHGYFSTSSADASGSTLENVSSIVRRFVGGDATPSFEEPVDPGFSTSSAEASRVIFTRPRKESGDGRLPDVVSPTTTSPIFERNPAGSPVQTSSLNSRELESLQNQLRVAAGLNALAFDAQLEQNIQNYLNTGPSCSGPLEHSPIQSRTGVAGFRRLGENLWKGHWSPPPSSMDIVQDWYNEKFCFKYGPLGKPCSLVCNSECSKFSPRAGCQTGHFTQMLWEGLTHMACATKTCGGATLAGCVYGKLGGAGGNYIGAVPFNPSVGNAIGVGSSTCAAATALAFRQSQDGEDENEDKAAAEVTPSPVYQDELPEINSKTREEFDENKDFSIKLHNHAERAEF